jgi:hypothetical protein
MHLQAAYHNILVKLILESLLFLRIQLVLSQCSEGQTIEGIALVVQYLGGHQTPHIPRRAKIPSILFLVFSHSHILIKPNPLIECELGKKRDVWSLSSDNSLRCLIIQIMIVMDTVGINVSHQFQAVIPKSLSTSSMVKLIGFDACHKSPDTR